jgi:subtilase family serine protease
MSALLLAGCGGATNALLPAGANSNQSTTASERGLSEFQRDLADGNIAPSCAQGGEEVRCFAYVLTQKGRAAAEQRGALAITPNALPAGFGPTQLQAAYKTAGLTGGTGRLIAIVDAYDNPNLEADLGVYRSTYGLPACTTANGCFKKVGQTGTSSLPKANASWGQETSLDVDMVSANCPNCKILVVEANSATFANLAAAVNTAANMGAVAISNSYGGSESSSQSTYRASYNHAGIAITASSGDSGYGAQSPASYNTLTAVGGTSLSTASNTRGWSETVWSGAGSGCSAYEAKPSFQTDSGCAKRTISDVSYVANPSTGVAVYDSYAYQGMKGWMVFGGTSVGAPAIAAIYGLAGNTVSDASYTYAHTASLFDVTSGSNGTCPTSYWCNAGVGYDGPTGNGTPNGIGAF